MKKMPNKCHQGALLNHNNFRVIFAGIALKIEKGGPTFSTSFTILATRYKGQQETVPSPKS